VTGAGYMLLSAFAFSLMTVFVKLGGVRLPWQELVVARAAVTLVLSYVGLRRASIPPLGTQRGLLALRGVFGFIALSAVYYSVTHLPLAEATVIQYLHPPLTAVMAAVILGERLERSVFFAMALGLLGLLLVAQPQALFGTAAAPLDPMGLAAAFLGAFFSSCAYITVRKLGRTEHPYVIIFYFPLVVHGAMLIEPTETESKRELDRFCDTLLALAEAAKAGDVERFKGAPYLAPARRLDETLAARKPRLRWRPEVTGVAPAPLAAE